MKYMENGIAAVLVLVSLPCVAQLQVPFPERPVRMIVGYTAGSEIDVVGRMLAQEMSEKWGQRVVVDNRPGAGGTVGGAIVAGAPPTGYTLFLNSVSHAATPALYSKLSYDTLRDFAAVSQVSSLPNVLFVASAQGARSVKELIALVKQKPGQMNFGSAGIGSGTHITGEMFRLGADLKVAHVPYKGVPEVIADTMTGRVHYSFAPIGNTLSFIKEKRIVALAVSTAARSPVLPDMPTVAESAIPNFEFDQWYGLFAPAKISRAVVSQVSREIVRIGGLPSFKERLIVRGAVPRPSTPEEFDRFVRNEVARLTKVIKDGGVRIE